MRTRLITFALAVISAVCGRAGEDDWFRPLGPPPKAAPRYISGGESLPPLPLPATPLRRTERKRQPSPPTLAGKVVWGQSALFTYDNGMSTKIADWNLCPADLQQLIAKAGRWMNVPYGSDAVTLSSFHGDPDKMPVLLFSGGRTLKLDKPQTDQLRSFVLRGGMLLFDSVAGSPYFYESSKRVVGETFPELSVRVIPPDHPVYHMLFDVEEVTYCSNAGRTPSLPNAVADVGKEPARDAPTAPCLEGVYVGCRVGALISRYGLGCGWDDREVPLIKEAVYYDVASANKIGANMIAYAVGYLNVGREEAKPELFGAIDEKSPTDDFVFAQIEHEGAWNVHPGGAAALLQRLRQDTSVRVNLKRVAVVPGRDDISGFHCLYLTGLDDFRFDDKAVASLRGFLSTAGTLLISNGLGLRTFDAAVRRELKKVLPEAALMPLAADDPVYSTVFRITEARYTPRVVREKPDLKAPVLEGIVVNGDLRVIYSPYDLEAGWQGCEHPLARAYEPDTAMRLGVNIVMYAMTH